MGLLCIKGSREDLPINRAITIDDKIRLRLAMRDDRGYLERLQTSVTSAKSHVSDAPTLTATELLNLIEQEQLVTNLSKQLPSSCPGGFTNDYPQQISDDTSNPVHSGVQHTYDRVNDSQNISQTDTVAVAKSPKSMPNLHTVLQPSPRMNYLQKYSPSSCVFKCDHNGGVVTSEDGTIKLTIPSDAIMDGDLVIFHFLTCLYGPFILPSHHQTDLASPYYRIAVSKSYRFHKPVKVEFQHFAVVTACDPSHFQLLECEDDNESFTMRSVDYALNFKIQDDISWCTFQTNHFCSYCLSHHFHHDHRIMTRIGAFFLKPKNFQSLDHFMIEVWFSFTISHCLKRNKELYTSKDMILDKQYSCYFEASSDKSSTSYLTLNYDQCNDGWILKHSRFNKIPTKDINFYNNFTNEEDLKANEEASLFPPRFILGVQKKPNCYNDLKLTIEIALFRKTLSTKSIPFELFVPISRDSTNSTLQKKVSLPPHFCKENEPELKDLTKYSTGISPHWKEIALHLDIPREKVEAIDSVNHQHNEKKCYEVFSTWLQKKVDPCWCHFIKALYNVGLNSLAEKVKTHLTLSENTVDYYQLEKLLDNVPEPIITQLLSKYTKKVKVVEDTGNIDVRSIEGDAKKHGLFPKESNPSQTKACTETTV